MPRKCSRNFVAITSQAGLNEDISTAIVSIVRQKLAIQLVASDSSSRQPGGSGAERSNRPMLSMPRKPPSNRFDPSASLRLTHQPKFSSSLPKTRVRKSWSRRPSIAIDLPRRPRVHRRVDVAEGPLVGRQLAVGVHRPLAAQQQQLLLGRGRVDVRQRDAVEGEVPRREPRVLPLVGHADDVGQRRGAARRRCGPAARRARPAAGGRPGRRRAIPRPSSGRAACPTAARRRRAGRSRGRSSRQRRRAASRRRRRRPRRRGRRAPRRSRCRRCAWSGGAATAAAAPDRLARRDGVEAVPERGLGAGRRRDSPRASSPCTTRPPMPSFVYGVGLCSAPNSATALVSLSQTSTSGVPSAART